MRLAPPPLNTHLPDPRRPAIADTLSRNLFFEGGLSSQHTTLTVGNTQTQVVTAPMRIRSAQVGSVAGGTVTVQVLVDGRDLFADAQRPVSGAGSREATDLYVIPTGSVVSTSIEADSGTPSGTANVSIQMEPYVVIPRSQAVVLHHSDRLRVSRRRQAQLINDGLATPDEARALLSSRTAAITRRQFENEATPGWTGVGQVAPPPPPRGGGGPVFIPGGPPTGR